ALGAHVKPDPSGTGTAMVTPPAKTDATGLTAEETAACKQLGIGMGDAVGGTSPLIAASSSGLAGKLAEPVGGEAFGRVAETLTTGLTLAIDAVTALAPLMSALTAIMAGLAAVQIGTWIAGLVSGLAAATAAGLAFVATPFGAAIAAIGIATAGIAALWLES